MTDKTPTPPPGFRPKGEPKPPAGFAPKTSIWENVWGKGEIDTPGERLGAAINRKGQVLWSGLLRGGSALADTPGAVMSGIGGAVEAGLEKVGANPDFAAGVRAGIAPGPLSEAQAQPLARSVAGDEVYDREGEGLVERTIGTTGEMLPGLLFGGGFRGVAGAGIGSEALGTAAEGRKVHKDIPLIGGTDLEPYARVAGAVIGGGAGQALDDVGMQREAVRQYIKAAPSGQSLKDQAGQLYKQAHARGVVAQPKQYSLYKKTLERLAKREGFITPKGNVVSGNSSLGAVMKSLDDYVDEPVSVLNLQAIRSQLQRVANDPDQKVSRMGTILLKSHDRFVDRLAPELKTANALYTRAMRGEMMDRVEDLADIKASQLTQSGMENALRSEYRALDRQIVRGKVKGLRPDQAQAVQDVSRGTPASNTARNIGKAAPTGVVSAGISGGIPYLIGNSIGGPQVGAILSGAMMSIGTAGRVVSTALQQRAAEYASAAMRSGAPMEEIERTVRNMLLGATVTSVANQASKQAE